MSSPPLNQNTYIVTKIAELDTIWDDLQNGVEQVFRKKNENMSKYRYMELYS